MARNIIELDGHNFAKTYQRVSDIFNRTEVPEIEKSKIGLNDFYRLENKMAFALYL